MTRAQRAFARQHLGLARQQAHRFARLWALPVDDLLGPLPTRGCVRAPSPMTPAAAFAPPAIWWRG